MNLRSIGIVCYVGGFLLCTTPARRKLRRLEKTDPEQANKIAHQYVKRALKNIIAISGSTVETEGLENIPDEACLFVGNHTGYFDIMVTETVIPTGVGYVAKDSFSSIPGLSAWMDLIHCLFLNRSDPKEGIKTILKGAEYLKEGYSMLIFPEGTRSKDGQLGEFKGGSLKMAQKAHCPIVPVAISGSSTIFEDNKNLSIKPSTVNVTFGKPIYISQMSRAEQKLILEQIKETIGEILVNQKN